MTILLLTAALFALVMLAMSVGVILSGRSLRGSCGGSSCQCRADGRPEGSCDNDLIQISPPREQP